MSVIGGTTNTVIATVALGRRSAGVAVSSRAGIIYAANEASNTLSVISGRTNKVTATIRRVSSAPWAVAVNPRTRAVDLTDFAGRAVSVLT